MAEIYRRARGSCMTQESMRICADRCSLRFGLEQLAKKNARSRAAGSFAQLLLTTAPRKRCERGRVCEHEYHRRSTAPLGAPGYISKLGAPFFPTGFVCNGGTARGYEDKRCHAARKARRFVCNCGTARGYEDKPRHVARKAKIPAGEATARGLRDRIYEATGE